MKILDTFFDAFDSLRGLFRRKSDPQSEQTGLLARLLPVTLLVLIAGILILGFLWSSEPDSFSPVLEAKHLAGKRNDPMTTGYITTATIIKIAETLLDKPGGYLSNDKLPPGILMDNIPNWEFGVLTQVRDITLAMRNDLTRSQSQSIEDKDIIIAENRFRIDSKSWMLPPAESEYRKGIDALYAYLTRLVDEDKQDGQFFARADNLNEWLGLVSKRLGSLSQRLSASVGQQRLNTDLAGDAEAHQSTPTGTIVEVKTSWFHIDDIFYETRGSAWALSHLLKAAETDYLHVLEKKNALVSLQQIVRELESTQTTLWSPMILNGSGFAMFANHSLVMANYISRANAAVIDLRGLLKNG